jgi:hypothetical protein
MEWIANRSNIVVKVRTIEQNLCFGMTFFVTNVLYATKPANI